MEGSFNTTSFGDFIEGLLDQMNQFPGPNSVIVMDNCRIHKSEAVLQIIEERYSYSIFYVLYLSCLANYCIFSGMRYEFLPPYSPDFNPIEPGFSAIKGYIRRNGGLFRVATESQDERAAVLTFLHEAVFSVTPQDAEGWFRHSNYL